MAPETVDDLPQAKEAITREPEVWDNYLAGLPVAGIILCLYLTSLYSNLLFHSLTEGVSIAAALGVFMVAWHSRRFLDNGYLSFVGLAYLFVALLDMLHTLAYEGTGIFPGQDADLNLKLWVAARYLQSLSLLAAPFFLGRKLRYNLTFITLALITAGLVAAIFWWRIFPTSSYDGGQLTPFKRMSEYVIAGIFLMALILLRKKHVEFDPIVLRWLTGSIGFSILAELFFSSYLSVFGPFYFLAHFSTIISFYLAYKAVIETGLVKPYTLLFRNLKRSEEELRIDNDKLTILQKLLAVTNQELQKLNDLKNQFIGMAAHDLRSPLSAVLLYSEFIQERHPEGLDDQQMKFLSQIKKSSRFMLSLVEDLLDIAKIESGKLVIEPRKTNLASLVEQNVALNRVIADHKGVRIAYESDNAPEEAWIDPERIEQALNNLISNAVKFSHKGSLVEVRLAGHGEDAVISVKDEGQGIPPGEHHKLFHAFSRTTVRGTSGEKSSGLGLAITRKIIEAHGGRVWMESSVGKGSTFYMFIPLASSVPAKLNGGPSLPLLH